MARKVRDSRIETRQARLRLPVPADREPYWRLVHEGLHLGYRKAPRGGVWMVRFKKDDDKYVKKVIGHADDFQDSNGANILSYGEVLNKALEYAADGMGAPAPLTFQQAADRYLTWFKEHRKGYRETELAVKAHILPTFAKKLVSEITTKEIRDWLNKLAATSARKRSGKGRKQSFRDAPKTDDAKRARKASANRTLAILKALLNKAFQDELTKDDMAWRRVKPFGKVDEPVVRFLTEAESIRLANACNPDLRALVHAGLFTGARCAELTGLQAKDVNTETQQVYIKPAKSGKGRYVPLSFQGLEFFKALVAGKTGEQKVFLKDNGTVWGRNHHARALQEACKNARIEPTIGFHELRHTYASLLAQAGADLLTISKLLGHADTRVTSRHYAHLCDRTLANAVQNFLPNFGHKSESNVKAIR